MLTKPDLSKPIFMIFQPKLRQAILNNECPFCKEHITEESFRDEVSKKEYSISGICQKCQDSTFNQKTFVMDK